ncbi:MAG: pilus assembly protein [Chloroflexi bacterium]|nr:pilus assembly protein [Chloroflexota bacterium]
MLTHIIENLLQFKGLFAKRRARKQKKSHKAQSLVEIAITFPVLLMLLSGLVEFGFMLNYYLSLTDVTRETARFFSNFDPFNPDGSDDLTFYQNAAGFLIQSLEPRDAQDTTKKIQLDSAADDIIISVFSVSGGTATLFPTSGEYHWFNNDSSRFSTTDIASQLVGGAPNTGILLVEVFYDYHQVLAFPWVTAFVPDPVTLYAYTMMPLAAAEPTPTPIP